MKPRVIPFEEPISHGGDILSSAILRLFIVALTCNYFVELWEELDSLVSLLKPLPALEVEDEVYVGAYFYDLILCYGP